MTKQLLISVIVLFCTFSLSQAQLTFQKSFGGADSDEGHAISQTSDGGYIIAGTTESFGAGNADVYLIKTNVNGDTLWTKTFGGADEEVGYSVQQTSDGGYIIAGVTSIVGSGITDIYLIKTDSFGNALWTKTIGEIGPEYVGAVLQTSNGGYIIAGSTWSFGPGISDVFLTRTDINGNQIWTKTYGGIANDEGYSLKQTQDGGYIISGSTESFGAGFFDVYLIKTDANGVVDWTKTYGGSGSEAGTSVHLTADGGYVVAGSTIGFGSGTYDIYLLKTDSIGTLIWSRTFGGTAIDWANCVQPTTDGGYVIAAHSESFGIGTSKVCLIKTDANGAILWTRVFGGLSNDDAFFIQQTNDGGFIVAGRTHNFGAGNDDVYLIKTTNLGNSGCNQTNPASLTTTPATISSLQSTITTPEFFTVLTSPTNVGSGGMVSTLCTTVGGNEIGSDISFTVAPNPTSGDFEISFEEMITKGKLEIFNILGEIVFTDNITMESKKVIRLNAIPGGIYFVKVFDGEKYFSKKIIIEKK